MGGNAFNAVLRASAFPRLPPAVYEVLKARFLPRIQKLYTFVAVPIEAPGKATYGDLDFVVASPISGLADATEGNSTILDVPHPVVQDALGAQFVNPLEGNRTSNFAVSITPGEWAALNHAKEEEDARQAAEDGKIFYQIDVKVCTDKSEWDRIMFFHSYGDMGMIFGLIAKNVGLKMGEKGLKYPNPPNEPITLSQDFDQITTFMGISMDAWKAGFRSRTEVFEWLGASRFFDPTRFKSRGEGFRKVKQERKMYHEFVQWAIEKDAATSTAQNEKSLREKSGTDIKEEALDYFGKREFLESLAHKQVRDSDLKGIFSGHRVRDWTNLGEYWKGVKLVMDTVRERYDGDEGVLKIYDAEGEDAIRKIVVQVKEEVLVELDGRYVQRPVDHLVIAMSRAALEG